MIDCKKRSYDFNSDRQNNFINIILLILFEFCRACYVETLHREQSHILINELKYIEETYIHISYNSEKNTLKVVCKLNFLFHYIIIAGLLEDYIIKLYKHNLCLDSDLNFVLFFT